MIFTGAPQNTKRVPTDRFFIDQFHQKLTETDIKSKNIIIHAPYIINLANTIKPYVFKIGVEFLEMEIKRAQEIGIKIIVLHPGSSVGANIQNSLDSVVKGLNQVLKETDDIIIALETMSGKGYEIGRNFDQLKYIIDNVKFKDKIAVCWDNMSFMKFWLWYLVIILKMLFNEFDEKIGLDKLVVFHINDSKTKFKSNKDRHENIGYGDLGFKILNNIVHHPKFINIPKILETPYVNNKPPYKYEIDMFKNKKYIDFKILITG